MGVLRVAYAANGVVSLTCFRGSAEITSPVPDSVLTGSTVTFTWSAAANADQYWLDVGTALGLGNISAGATSNLSKVVSGLPVDGSTVYVRLWTRIGGVWQSPTDYTFTANTLEVRAVMISPAPGSTLAGASVTFGWTTGSGANLYWLDVGSAPGQGNYSAGALASLSKLVNGLPTDGSVIYARLWTRIGGVWKTPIDYTYVSGP